MSTSAQPEQFKLGSAFFPIYLPAFLFAAGEGAIIPIIPTTATLLGADLAMAGLIAALLTIGSLVGNIPAGMAVERLGERNSMILAACVAMVGAVLAGFAPTLFLFACSIFILGMSHSVFALARHAFMTTFVPLSHRARAISTLGGSFRGGIFVGPFIGAGIIALFDDPTLVYFTIIALAAIIILVLFLLEDPTEALIEARLNSTANIPIIPDRPEPMWRTLHKFRKPLLRLGIPAAILSGLRTSRQVLLPLWGVSIGLSAQDIATIMGIAGAIDFALFYTGGVLMDRFGRMWTAVPSLIALSIGFLALGFTHDLDENVFWFIVFAMFLSFANGVSSGILMTLGSDLAPKYNPAPFLATYRLVTDSGQATAPVLISAMIKVLSISWSAFIVAGLGFVGAGLFIIFMPRYDPLLMRMREAKRQAKKTGQLPPLPDDG